MKVPEPITPQRRFIGAMYRAPLISDLTKLNLRTTARWERCRHRYDSDHMLMRDYGGPDVWMHVCLRCKVPTVLGQSFSLTKAQAVKSSALRGAMRGALKVREQAAA